jgi:hypothetical protein
VAHNVRELREFVLEVVKSRTELRLFDLLEVKLRTEAVVLVFEVGDPAANLRRRRPDGGRDARFALGTRVSRSRGGGGRRMRGGVSGDDSFSAQLRFELCHPPFEEECVLLLAVSRGLSGVYGRTDRVHEVSLGEEVREMGRKNRRTAIADHSSNSPRLLLLLCQRLAHDLLLRRTPGGERRPSSPSRNPRRRSVALAPRAQLVLVVKIVVHHEQVFVVVDAQLGRVGEPVFGTRVGGRPLRGRCGGVRMRCSGGGELREGGQVEGHDQSGSTESKESHKE